MLSQPFGPNRQRRGEPNGISVQARDDRRSASRAAINSLPPYRTGAQETRFHWAAGHFALFVSDDDADQPPVLVVQDVDE